MKDKPEIVEIYEGMFDIYFIFKDGKGITDWEYYEEYGDPKYSKELLKEMEE